MAAIEAVAKRPTWLWRRGFCADFMVFPSLLSTRRDLVGSRRMVLGPRPARRSGEGRVRRVSALRFLSLAGVIALARCCGSATAGKLISLSFGSYKRHLSYNFRQRCQTLWATWRVAIRTARAVAPYLFAQTPARLYWLEIRTVRARPDKRKGAGKPTPCPWRLAERPKKVEVRQIDIVINLELQ
jgi:hypothetical protein